MDDGSRMYLGLALGIFFILIKGFFTACETAVIEVNDTKLKRQAENDKRAQKLLEITSQPTKLLVSLSVFKALTTVIVSIISAVAFFYPLKDKLQYISDSNTLISVIDILIILFVITLLLVVFGDSIPKKLAMKHSENFALSISGLLKGLMILLSPFTKLISVFTFIFGKMFGFSINSDKEAVTEEEILMMVDAVNETGVIEESQKEMINNIFEFDDLEVSDVMTHRTDMVAIEKSSSIKELTMLAISEGFSRIPVYRNNIDNIVGVIYIKDLLALIGSENVENSTIADFMRDIMYVPQTNRCGELLKEFTSIKALV